ncbi:hypothetical protein EDD37DRAFT_608355 [Exophiala viscosa]|uniref:uncharacterized protein n=1 Tax=Exophiala viscosa TaxID=2486360 RepID=UPI00219C3F95|nr:hypothetical protein EDD37DRAFT_608355 [Exophiala viscosa]
MEITGSPYPATLSPRKANLNLKVNMPNGTYFQAAPTPIPPPDSTRPGLARNATTFTDLAAPNDATTKLTEAIDDFLGDLEKKFKGISDEILTKLDDMAERCDRLEQEMLLRDASTVENVGKAQAGPAAGSI